MQFLAKHKDTIATVTGLIIALTAPIMAGDFPVPDSVKAIAGAAFSLAALIQGLLIGKYPKFGSKP